MATALKSCLISTYNSVSKTTNNGLFECHFFQYFSCLGELIIIPNYFIIYLNFKK